jgi:hypothetical protein
MCNPSDTTFRELRGLKIACDEFFYIRGHLDFIYMVTDRRTKENGDIIIRGYNRTNGDILINETSVIFIEGLN